jgi:hypothetical protein
MFVERIVFNGCARFDIVRTTAIRTNIYFNLVILRAIRTYRPGLAHPTYCGSRWRRSNHENQLSFECSNTFMIIYNVEKQSAGLVASTDRHGNFKDMIFRCDEYEICINHY